MPVLNKEEFFNRINERIGADTSDDAISFLEDMADTYNALSTSANGSEAEVWKKRYEDNDAAWKKKYQHRFFSGADMNYTPYKDEEEDISPNREDITIDQLFEMKETK